MQKIFEQYGGVITTAMAIVALVSLIGIFFTADGDGWMDNAFHDVVDGFANKVENAVPSNEPAWANASASGGFVYVSDVYEEEHNLSVSLVSDTLTDFSGIAVKRLGKNLVDVTELASIRNTTGLTTDAQRGLCEFEKTSESRVEAVVAMDIYLPAGTYTFSAAASQSDGLYGSAMLMDKGTYESLSTSVWSAETMDFTFNVPESKIYSLRFYSNFVSEPGTVTTFSNIQIEPGESATGFAPYAEQLVAANADGSVNGLVSVSPYMTIVTENDDVTINCDYKQKKN